MGKEKMPSKDRTEKKTASSGVWEIKSESGKSDRSEQKPRRSRLYSGKPEKDSQERRPRRSSTSSEKETRKYSTTSERENYSGKREDKPRRSRSYSGKPEKDSQERRPRRSSTSSEKDNYSDRREQKSGRIRSYSGKQDRENYSDKQGQKPRRSSRLHPEKPVRKPEKNSEKKDELVRLNKFIANSGICSRREADEYITAGLVSVNGQIITELGTKIRRDDDVRFNKERLKGENKAYVLLNKPKNYITTTDDPHAKKTVMELVEGACKERVYPVGRLDRNSTGVLLFTNDGDLAKQLTHPSHNKLKVYQVRLNKNITKADLKALLEGVELEDGPAVADDVHISDTKKDELGIEIHSGKNRVIRRMFEKLGYEVVKLDRVYFAGLTKKGLRRGQYRLLTPKEVEMLKMGAYK
ncbi:MAG: rRNA pseudouridine synthase [Prevotellaceae bacterium]|jgi:23S rRNA pseudouridine2605 synthase|nr:rRNA pseudouridine synthase [Prevotellaceae bacterium]